jgi:hypothetical protein
MDTAPNSHVLMSSVDMLNAYKYFDIWETLLGDKTCFRPARADVHHDLSIRDRLRQSPRRIIWILDILIRTVRAHAVAK